MPGRPRDPELEQRLLSTTWSLLVANGYDALTLSQVAAGAGAHRTDVYRRWDSKAQLVADALAENLPPVPAFDTGSLLGDLRANLEALAAAWSASWIHGLVGLLGDLAKDAKAEAAFLAMAGRRGQVTAAALARAVARGEVTASVERGLLDDLLEGPLMHRVLITRRPLTPEYLDAVAHAVHQQLIAPEAPCTT